MKIDSLHQTRFLGLSIRSHCWVCLPLCPSTPPPLHPFQQLARRHWRTRRTRSVSGLDAIRRQGLNMLGNDGQALRPGPFEAQRRALQWPREKHDSVIPLSSALGGRRFKLPPLISVFRLSIVLECAIRYYHLPFFSLCNCETYFL